MCGWVNENFGLPVRNASMTDSGKKSPFFFSPTICPGIFVLRGTTDMMDGWMSRQEPLKLNELMSNGHGDEDNGFHSLCGLTSSSTTLEN